MILVLILAISLIANVVFSRYFRGGASGMVHQPETLSMTSLQLPAGGHSGQGPRIAQINLTGIISGDSQRGRPSMVAETQAAFSQALADPLIKAIVLRIDSPGGEVTASDSLYQTVKEADTHKPVIALMDSMAASGGYYIACGARRIIAHPTTWTGSIGVIVQTLGYAPLLDKVGLKMRVFKSGAFKDATSGHREMTPEEEKYLQGIVMQTYDRFVGIVSQSRGISVDQLKSGVADGRIVTGTDALAQKLVDQLGYASDAWQLARDEAGITDAEVVEYGRSPGLISALGLLGQAAANTGTQRLEIDLSDRLLPGLQAGRVYLLPQFMSGE